MVTVLFKVIHRSDCNFILYLINRLDGINMVIIIINNKQNTADAKLPTQSLT